MFLGRARVVQDRTLTTTVVGGKKERERERERERESWARFPGRVRPSTEKLGPRPTHRQTLGDTNFCFETQHVYSSSTLAKKSDFYTKNVLTLAKTVTILAKTDKTCSTLAKTLKNLLYFGKNLLYFGKTCSTLAKLALLWQFSGEIDMFLRGPLAPLVEHSDKVGPGQEISKRPGRAR